MKIAVIGAGVVGICTAYELAQDGHTVSVFERNALVAEEASFACAGNLSPSLSHPLSFPSKPTTSRLRAMLAPTPITVGRGATISELSWLKAWKTAAQSHSERFTAMQRLAAYSLERMHTLSARAAIAHEQARGHMLLFKTESTFLGFQDQFNALKELGIVGRIFTPDEARQLEPDLSTDIPLHSAICYAADEVGNCRQFAQALKEKLVEGGVQLHFGTTVSAIAQGTGVQLHTDTQGPLDFDQVVICAGAGSAALLGPAYRQLPLTRLWSYSLSAQIKEPFSAPRSAVHDCHRQVSLNRIGARIRVSGGAELGGTADVHNEKIIKLLYQALQSNFPGAADYSRSMQTWKGCSIFSPDNLPLIGSAGSAGIWLNLAHGHNGWSMACGAARILADQLKGAPSDLDTTLLQPARFKS
jgi:D-amino-acid dehydrogenase